MRSPAADLGAQARAVVAGAEARTARLVRWAWGGVAVLALGVALALTACARTWPPMDRPEWRQLDPAMDHPWPPVPGVAPEWRGAGPMRWQRACGAGACGGGR